jgi:uncharacterized protein (DUF302 family)
MSYYLSKNTYLSFDETVNKIKHELYKAGLTILSEINMKDVMGRELGINFRPYKIIGVCSSISAYRAIMRDKSVGTVLPSNIVVQQKNGSVTVATEDPLLKMKFTSNNRIAAIANRVQLKIKNVVEKI